MKKINLVFFAISLVFWPGAYGCPKGEPQALKGKKRQDFTEPVKAGIQKIPETSLHCKNDEDCTVIKNDCCGCRQGGTQRAIAKALVNSAEAEQEKRCQGTMCIQAISTDASCSKNSVCESDNCILK